MDIALYCPVYGYYEKEADTVGRRGDYYTSVSVGSLFGELLALQFSLWLESLAQSSPDPGSHPAPGLLGPETARAVTGEVIPRGPGTTPDNWNGAHDGSSQL